jgi:hypothetical protein
MCGSFSRQSVVRPCAGTVYMVELYRKGDFKKPERRKAGRPGDRRAHPRYVFFADCEVTDGSSGSRYETRVTEISLGGCFVDLAVLITQGTDLHLRISNEDRTFEADARAVYTFPSMGNGIAFISVSPEDQLILEDWIQSLQR